MNKYLLLALSQMINGEIIRTFRLIDESTLEIYNIRFRYYENSFGEIYLYGKCSLGVFKKILSYHLNDKQIELFIQNLFNSKENRERYSTNVQELLLREKINEKYLENCSNDEFYAITSRFMDREEEFKHYVFMYLNTIPYDFRIDKKLKLDLPLVDIKYNDELLNSLFSNGIPIHPLSITTQDKINCTKNFYFSGSHRTFFSEDLPFYFKLDVPKKISSSLRTLTRTGDRIAASAIAFEMLNGKTLSNMKKLWILPDVYGYVDEHNYRSIVLRKKNNALRMFPLYALLYEFEKDLTLFDLLLKNEAKKDVLQFALDNFVYPIIEILVLFYKLPGDRFIQPYNFHRQNVNVVISQGKVVAYAVQDIDKQQEKKPQSFYVEYDNCLCKFYFEALKSFLHNKYNVDENMFSQNIKDYFTEICEINKYICGSNNNRIYMYNIISKDFKSTTCDRIYTCKRTVYR